MYHFYVGVDYLTTSSCHQHDPHPRPAPPHHGFRHPARTDWLRTVSTISSPPGETWPDRSHREKQSRHRHRLQEGWKWRWRWQRYRKTKNQHYSYLDCILKCILFNRTTAKFVRRFSRISRPRWSQHASGQATKLPSPCLGWEQASTKLRWWGRVVLSLRQRLPNVRA